MAEYYGTPEGISLLNGNANEAVYRQGGDVFGSWRLSSCGPDQTAGTFVTPFTFVRQA